jgi:hypothetical protein
MKTIERPGGLLKWQWGLYADGHHDRRNLLVHALTVPLFMLGTVAVLAGPFAGLWLLPAGLVLMVLAMGLQGQTHRREKTPPVPFQGPLDVVARILAEQWVTFPRFCLTGGFTRALRGDHPKANA